MYWAHILKKNVFSLPPWHMGPICLVGNCLFFSFVLNHSSSSTPACDLPSSYRSPFTRGSSAHPSARWRVWQRPRAMVSQIKVAQLVNSSISLQWLDIVFRWKPFWDSIISQVPYCVDNKWTTNCTKISWTYSQNHLARSGSASQPCSIMIKLNLVPTMVITNN